MNDDIYSTPCTSSESHVYIVMKYDDAIIYNQAVAQACHCLFNVYPPKPQLSPPKLWRRACHSMFGVYPPTITAPAVAPGLPLSVVQCVPLRGAGPRRSASAAAWSAVQEAGEGLAVEHVKDIAALSLRVDTEAQESTSWRRVNKERVVSGVINDLW
jgi:hypothetical protein